MQRNTTSNISAIPPVIVSPQNAGAQARESLALRAAIPPVIVGPQNGHKSVAIVGTEGTGKTVLLTVLANKLGSTKSPTYLECLNKQALVFKRENWQTLCSQDWPAGTPEGRHFELHFNLHSGSGVSYPMRALDFSGQNFRKLFANEQINLNRQQLPENLRSLADFLQTTSIVVVLVNLSDFMDHADAATRASNEWALKYCLDYLKKGGRRVCIVLSQADRYRKTITDAGGAKPVIEEYLPEVFNAHLRNGSVAVFSVAAVADKVKLTRPGEPVREVPAAEFKSDGIDELVGWIGQVSDAVENDCPTLKQVARALGTLVGKGLMLLRRMF